MRSLACSSPSVGRKGLGGLDTYTLDPLQFGCRSTECCGTGLSGVCWTGKEGSSGSCLDGLSLAIH